MAVRYFGVDPSIADRLPELQEAGRPVRRRLHRRPSRAADDGLLKPHDERPSRSCFGEGAETVGPLELQQRGLAAMINATAATTTARMLLGEDFRRPRPARRCARCTPPFGRGEVIDADGQPLELVLVKNPAGFTVALGTYGTHSRSPR